MILWDVYFIQQMLPKSDDIKMIDYIEKIFILSDWMTGPAKIFQLLFKNYIQTPPPQKVPLFIGRQLDCDVGCLALLEIS